MQLLKIILAIAVLMYVCIGCAKRQNSTYPSIEQIKNFSMQNNLKVLDEKNIDNVFSVILYEDNERYGYYILYLDSKGVLRNDNYYNVVDNNSKLYIAGQSSGKPFIVVVFNDMSLLDVAAAIKFQYANGKSDIFQLSEKKKGKIIPISNEASAPSGYLNPLLKA
ncbi:hypothetical protein P4H70_06670 [Paenibacillus ehimensis]|uniref:hypothetical protein n=1 Tax=Paenibacillus ehimensis TaxID=79264 RepID=UPI002C0BED12|nr:hypothetical protein [Paenibacillus ehimensis]MEC0208631.1 hypothetical protein [Paenibacillus ehimensis]HWO95587.1 hypothetical protein [Bacillus sp. (in: firmicutes)]